MEQESYHHEPVQLEPKSEGGRKNLIIFAAVGFIVGAAVGGWIVYLKLDGFYSAKQLQLSSQLSQLQQKNNTLEKQNKNSPTPATPKQDPITATDPIPSFSDSPAITTCDFWKDRPYEKVHTDIEGDDAAGTLSLKGQIVQRLEEASWKEGEKVLNVYLLISDPTDKPQQVFYDRYMEMVQRNNSINRDSGKQLLFRIGIKEDSKLVTSANISNKLSNRLLSLIDTPETVQLKLTIPIYGGGGVGDYFSFACDISE